ncbi:MAG TPA: hypothetical protein VMC85_04915 [Desulfomonilaceae bacterium]|nr:hypothetical protein [Desulfomonilaceae bacterium]
MVIIRPLKVLVCLAILSTFTFVTAGWGYNGVDISGGTGIQGEALSADPRGKPATPMRSLGTSGSSHKSSKSHKSHTSGTSSSTRSPEVSISYPPADPVFPAYRNPGLVYPPQGYPLPPGPSTQFAAGPQNLFCPSGWNFCMPWYVPFLPRIGPKQFQINAKLWYAQLNASTVLWGTDFVGGQGTELDLVRDLGLSKHQYIAEYEARCQLRCNWGLRFSFMPIAFKDNSVPAQNFFFGNAFFPAAVPIVARWHRYIYRWDIVYDWYQQKHAVSSIFAGYSLYDDKIEVEDIAQSRNRSRGFGLGFAGMSIDRVIRNLGCGGAAASAHCKGSLQFLEGYFGWDAYATGRISVPMDCGRFGYIEAGWRWMVLERSQPSDIDRTSLDGLIGAVGFVF